MAFKAALFVTASASAMVVVQPALAQATAPASSVQPGAGNPSSDQSNGSVAAVREPPAVDRAAPDAGSPAAGAAEADIVVTGVRGSLASAQAIKRNAVQIVDSIVAEDIGKLPDNTVSDALQRVTGVQVTRGAGEATSVLVRGLPNVATLLNGREAFTGTGRGFALQDIPAELIAGVDVYKTNTPDLIEGGITGLIDVRLRRPFDFKGFQVAGSGRAVYSDQADKWGYIGSGLISNRWETGAGEFGALVGVSYNRRRYQDQTAFDFISSGTPIATPDTVGGLYTSGDRKRLAVNTSLQWKPSPDLEFYADGVFTQYKETQAVDFFIGLPKAGAITAITARGDAPSLAQTSTTAASDPVDRAYLQFQQAAQPQRHNRHVVQHAVARHRL
jgi:iron complex outermembrane receptor protein